MQIIWTIDTDLQKVWGYDKGALGQIRGSCDLVFLNINDGNIRWSFDLTQLGTWQDYAGREKQTQISRILGIHDDKTYIHLNSGKILILNLQTGEQLDLIENNTEKGKKFRGAFGYTIELDADNNKLFQLARQDLLEVDLETGKVSQIFIEDMNRLNIENASFMVFDNEYIYFSDRNHYTLGALNRSTLKIDWIHKFEQTRFGRDLKLRENKLLVLDNKNTLHIFER